ncbi:MAG: lipoyl synthase [bacterium]|nr:lipoyl synthase [bacterium]
MSNQRNNILLMLPRWLKKSVPVIDATQPVRQVISDLKLNTVCRSAHCPNLNECFAAGTATFLILGNICTRNCSFCAVDKGIPESVDATEPERIAEAIVRLGIKHAVLTSVTRDDLPDGGAEQFVATITAIRRRAPQVTIEVLVPDFLGKESAIEQVLTAAPNVFNHNLETVERLYPRVRPQADYRRSIQLLDFAKRHHPNLVTKSGIMVGLGEEKNEIISLFETLVSVKCNILTIGQYLQPSVRHLPVEKYYTPAEFEELRLLGLNIGFDWVVSSPFTRSSYHAEQVVRQIQPMNENNI